VVLGVLTVGGIVVLSIVATYWPLGRISFR
jgi:hypothetical protein